MLTRLMTAAVAGLSITAALLFLMHYLIDTSWGEEPGRPQIRLAQFLPTMTDSPVESRPIRPEPIDPPQPPPALTPPADPGDRFTPICEPPPVDPPIMDSYATRQPGYIDGALVNIVAVQPVYPARALALGIEGFATVQFDVTTAGTVTNARIVESSSELLNRAAVDAAMKFRFRPRIVDGLPLASYGVMRRFTFEID